MLMFMVWGMAAVLADWVAVLMTHVLLEFVMRSVCLLLLWLTSLGIVLARGVVHELIDLILGLLKVMVTWIRRGMLIVTME